MLSDRASKAKENSDFFKESTAHACFMVWAGVAPGGGGEIIIES